MLEAMRARRRWGWLLAVIPACAGGEVEPRNDDAAVVVDARTDAVTDARADGGTDAGADVTVTDTGVDASVDNGAPVDVLAGDAAVRCMGNRDGVITRAEMAFLVGATVTYATNRTGTTVDPVSTRATSADGGLVWNFSAATAQDQRVLDEVIPPTGQWWSSSYPDATFATVVDRSTNLLGVYRVSDGALELLGSVSTEQNRTNLRFSPAVAVLRFPLMVGSTWTQTVTGTGFVNFTPLTNTTTYTTRIDQQGEVWTPAGRFPALRMRTDLDQSIPLTIFRVTRRTYTFVSECWGVVARLTSVDNESAEEFTRASEYRRLGL